MKISGFSYIRNGFEFDYPFIESMRSILPICDEFIMAVGDSHDGTREAIEALNDPKIKIVDTIWDEENRVSGKIFAQQANAALDQCTGDWCFHIQADELVHEDDLPLIKREIELANDNEKVEGLLFNFLNFWGSYHYIRTTRRVHRYEIRIIRNKQYMRSYRDSQGFRLYSGEEGYKAGEVGEKLGVKKIKARVFHYNYVRPPEKMKKKSDYFHRFWHTDEWLNENLKKENDFDFEGIDELQEFTGSHPSLMKDRVLAQDWEYNYDPSKSKFTFKNKLLHQIEKATGYRIGEYKNYKLIK